MAKWIKSFGLLAIVAAVAAPVAASATGGATVKIAKSKLGSILVLNQFGAPWWVLSAAGKEIHHG